MTTTVEWRKWNAARTKPITNYDRLISKTPEELAVFLKSCGTSCPDGHFAGDYGCHNCKDCWLDWLKQEA